MIRFKNLRKKYKNNAELIYKDYEINSGDFIAITGPSGSGKSTLLDLISNLSSPTSGTVEILGKEISVYEENEKEQANLRKLIGLMSPNCQLLSNLTIKENILLPFIINKYDIDNTKLHEISSSLDIENILSHLPEQLSTGQRQRALLCRSIILSPKILIADEPTANLDEINTKALVKFIEHLNDKLKTTIIVATHDKYVFDSAKKVYNLR